MPAPKHIRALRADPQAARSAIRNLTYLVRRGRWRFQQPTLQSLDTVVTIVVMTNRAIKLILEFAQTIHNYLFGCAKRKLKPHRTGIMRN